MYKTRQAKNFHFNNVIEQWPCFVISPICEIYPITTLVFGSVHGTGNPPSDRQTTTAEETTHYTNNNRKRNNTLH